MTETPTNLDNMSLSDLFDLGWKEQRELSKSGMCEHSSEIILKRQKSVDILIKCEFMLDELHLFSDNESLEEASTSELRYFLNYALLGWLFNKVNSNKPEIRLAALNEAKTYYLKYLKLTKNYELHKYNVDKLLKDCNNNAEAALLKNVLGDRQANFDAGLISQASDRNEKIKRYKEQKELEKQMEKMGEILDSTRSEQVDDENKRKYFLTCLKYWINQSLDDFKCIDDEINILKSIETKRTENQVEENRMYTNLGAQQRQQPANKPFIITKDAMQQKVFGMGYPSLPVYSIEEFYDMKVDDGCMPQVVTDPKKAGAQIGGGVTDSQKEDDKAKKDALADAHDEEEVLRMRGWDEFTDDNKRGAGNTYNRS